MRDSKCKGGVVITARASLNSFCAGRGDIGNGLLLPFPICIPARVILSALGLMYPRLNSRNDSTSPSRSTLLL